MIKDQDKSAYRIEFVIVSTGLTLVTATAWDLTPQWEQENANIGQPQEDTPGTNMPKNAQFVQESKEALKHKRVLQTFNRAASQTINTFFSLAVS